MREFMISGTSMALCAIGVALMLALCAIQWRREWLADKKERRSEDLRRRNKQSFAEMQRQIG